MKLVKYSACPANAIPEVKMQAGWQLETRGGEGAVWELLEKITELEVKP